MSSTTTTTTTTTAPSFVPDEFNDIDGFLSDREYWGYNVFKTLNGPPWTITKADRDEFNFIQDNKLVHLWKQESGYYYGQEVDQGRIYDPDANPPLGDWIYYGLTGALDIYTKVTLPSTTGMTEVSPGGGNFQFIYNDENGYGPGLWVYHADDVASTWQWVLASWVYNYNDDYDEGTYIGLGTDALDIWVRMTWPLDASTCKIYYALSEPDEDSDWIDITPTTYTFTPNGTDLPFLQMFSQGNSFNLPEDLYVYYDYFRRWPTFREDEFNDEAVADFWNIAGTGTVSEADSQLILSMDPSENAEVNQENLNDNLDIWCKVKLDTDKINYVGISNDYYDNDLYGYIGLSWDANGTFSGKRQFILEAYYEIDQGDTYVETIVGLGLNVNEVYIRMKYNNGRPFFFYALDEPQSNEDWIEIELPDLPSRNLVDYTIDLYSWTNAGSSLQALVDFIRNWSPEPILAGSQGARGSMIPGLINEGFGGFGFGWS